MTYHPLSNDTGGDDFARNQEAFAIIVTMKLHAKAGEMTERERDFVMQSKDRLERYGVKAMFSPKQVFWLRDLAEKYL
jgi:hypothetical protein